MLAPFLAVVLSYLVGALPFGVLVGKSLGVDVRTVGSGNTGTTNVWRALGPKAGGAVFALDVVKGLAGPLIGRAFHTSEGVVALCAVAAVVGHVFSIFLKGRGGKGIATALGAIIGLNALLAFGALALWGVVFGVSRFVSLASIAAAVTVLVAPWILKVPTPHALVMSAMGLLAIAKHIPNIKRLLNGTEPRVGQKKSEPNAASASATDAST